MARNLLSNACLLKSIISNDMLEIRILNKMIMEIILDRNLPIILEWREYLFYDLHRILDGHVIYIESSALSWTLGLIRLNNIL